MDIDHMHEYLQLLSWNGTAFARCHSHVCSLILGKRARHANAVPWHRLSLFA